jgi:hypothetical protein
MNMRLFTVIFMLLALFSTKQQAFAKCAFAKHTITGAVQDESTRQAISTATLYLFWDGHDCTISEGYETNPDFFTTDTNGIFVATGFFDTYSGGSLFGDRCNSKPKKLTVIVTTSGYLTRRVIFNTKDLKISGEARDHRIELPTILLYSNRGCEKRYTTTGSTRPGIDHFR